MSKKPLTADEVIRKEQGARLKAARVAAGYRSARQAAQENLWPESTVRAHESGGRKMGDDDAERYAKRYRANGVKVTAQMILFGGEPLTPARAATPGPLGDLPSAPSPHIPPLLHSVAVKYGLDPDRLRRGFRVHKEAEKLVADLRDRGSDDEAALAAGLALIRTFSEE